MSVEWISALLRHATLTGEFEFMFCVKMGYFDHNADVSDRTCRTTTALEEHRPSQLI